MSVDHTETLVPALMAMRLCARSVSFRLQLGEHVLRYAIPFTTVGLWKRPKRQPVHVQDIIDMEVRKATSY